MLKKTIVYPDLDGNDVTEDFYFNLSNAEIAEMEMSKKGGLSEYLQKLIDSEDGGQIIRTFKDIVAQSIGKRSDDNRRFVKTQEIRDDFMSSEAYSVLFMELITSPESGAEFIRGIVPAGLVAQVDATGVVNLQLPEVPAWIAEDRDPTKAELTSMTREQMQEVFERKNAVRIQKPELS